MDAKAFDDVESDVADKEPKRTSVIALPLTTKELINQRKTGQKKTLNDLVELHHLALWDTDEYRELLDAVYPEQAVEGDLYADDLEAARMIRVRADKAGDVYVANQKLATIRKALQVVQRRYGISRKERREA